MPRYSILTICLLGAVLTGCAQKTFRMDPKIRYRLDATARIRDINDKKKVFQIVRGIGVVRHEMPVGIRFETKGRFDLVYVNTCGRSQEAENEEKQYAISYIPDPDVEAKDECMMTLSGYDSKKNKHTFLLLAFASSYPHLNMPATVVCNGVRERFPLTACQSQSNTQIRVEFDDYTVIDVETPKDLPEELIPAVAVDCRTYNIDGTKIDNETLIARKIYQFPMPPGVCIYNFVDLLTGDKKAQVISYGYDEYAIREF